MLSQVPMVPEDFKVLMPSLPLGDPHMCSDSKPRLSLLAALYEPLVERTGPGVFRPLLAEAWETRDARVWEFKLRDGVAAHDGSSLEAEDAAASLRRVVDPRVGGAFGTEGVYASYLGRARFEAAGRLKLRLTSPEPIADLLELLVEMPMVPEAALDDLPGEHVGTGPYRLRDLSRDAAVMERNPRYWGKQPRHARLSWRGEPDEAARVEAVKAGEADVASGLGWRGRDHAEAEGVEAPSLAGALCVIFMFNCSAGPCADVRVRRALSHATDVPAIIRDIARGTAEPLTGPLTPLHFGHDPGSEPYAFNPGKARGLLAEAGHGAGLQVTVDVPSVMPDEAPELAKALAEQWERVGVSVRTRVHGDREAYSHAVRAKRIGDICCFDSSPLSAFRVLREKISSRHRGPWWEGYSNPGVDALLDRAQATVDDAERRGVYREAFRAVRGDAPWLFLYRPVNFWAVAPGAGWKPSWDGVVRVT